MRSARDPDRPVAHAPAERAEPFFRMWQVGRAAWPHLALGHEDFAAWLRARLAPDQDLAALCAADLFLVCACLLDVPGGSSALRQRLTRAVEPPLRRVIASARARAHLCHELASQLLAAHPADLAVHLSHYSGRGPLAMWLRLVALRRARASAAGATPFGLGPSQGRAAGREVMLVTHPSLRPNRHRPMA